MEDCFHCSINPEKFAPLPKEQQPYCSKCFDALFASVKISADPAAVPKAKPPPVPPKPKKSPIPYSTLPQPFQKSLMSPSSGSLRNSGGEVLETNLDEPYLRPPSSSDRFSDISSNASGDSGFSPAADEKIIIPGLGTKSLEPSPSPPMSKKLPSSSTSSPLLPRYSPTNYGQKRVEASAAVSKVIAERSQQFGANNHKNNVVRPLEVGSSSNHYNIQNGSSSGSNNRARSKAQEEGGGSDNNVVFKLTSLKPAGGSSSSLTRDSRDPWEDDMEYLNSLQNSGPGKRPGFLNAKPDMKCNVCAVSLMGKTVESKDSKLYCTPCYRTAMADRNCVKCGVYFTPDSNPVTYKNESWHQECFRCDKCKEAIGSKTFCSQKNGIFCSDCYFETSGRKCAKCSKYLTSTGLIFQNQAYHHECFTCTSCSQRIGETQIFCRDQSPYCSSCYDQKFADKCTYCKTMLTGEIIEFEGKQYHNDCFCCHLCTKPIGTASFFPKEGSILCESCYTAKYAKTCKKCLQIISPADGTGVIFKEENYHRKCFACTECTRSLVNLPVHTSQPDNQPFCRECYDARFSKSCAGCKTIISGVIGSKFMSYHGQYWHVDCFNCKGCGTSLENRKFNPYDGAIFCLACTRLRNQVGVN